MRAHSHGCLRTARNGAGVPSSTDDRRRQRVHRQASGRVRGARGLRAAEKAEDEAGVEGLDLLSEPNVLTLTQIFRELAPPDTPVLIEKLVAEVDAIAKEVSAGNSAWASIQKGDRAGL
jgi:hypothetical protein